MSRQPHKEVYGLTLFWAKTKEAFPFWKQRHMDWDALFQKYLDTLLQAGPLPLEDYYVLLQSFAAHLGDGHTYVRFPRHIQNHWAHPALQLEPLVDDNGVCMVVTGGELPMGTVIAQVDGFPADEVVKRVASRTSASTLQDLYAKVADTLLRRNRGTLVSLQVQLPDGQVTTWAGVAEHAQPSREFAIQHWPDGIAHVVLPHFQDVARLSESPPVEARDSRFTSPCLVVALVRLSEFGTWMPMIMSLSALESTPTDWCTERSRTTSTAGTGHLKPRRSCSGQAGPPRTP